MPVGASNSLWTSHCSRFTDETSLVKRIFVWWLDGGRWFIPTILGQALVETPSGVFLVQMMFKTPAGVRLAWTIHETPARPGPILSPNPLSVADSGKDRNTDCIGDRDAQSEQDLLQAKGARKDWAIS